MTRTARPWSSYLLRILCSALMFLTAYALLAGSTFALRMRNDFPIQTLVVALAAVFAFLPLAAGKRYLGALLVSAFLLAGIGGYWWTTIPWDEFIKDSGFPTSEKPDIMDFALVASPTVVAAFYAVAARPSIIYTDLKNRGADLDEARRAAAASFLAGSALLILCLGFAGALWAFMASGLAFAAFAPIPTGVPALVIVAALLSVAWFIFARQVPTFRPHRAPARAAAAEPAAVRRGAASRSRAEGEG